MDEKQRRDEVREKVRVLMDDQGLSMAQAYARVMESETDNKKGKLDGKQRRTER